MPRERQGSYGLVDAIEFAMLATAFKLKLEKIERDHPVGAEMSDGTAEFADGSKVHAIILAIPGGPAGDELYQRCLWALDLAGLKEAAATSEHETVEFPW